MAWHGLAWLASGACFIGWIHSCNKAAHILLANFARQFETKASQMELHVKLREFLQNSNVQLQ